MNHEDLKKRDARNQALGFWVAVALCAIVLWMAS
jgi:hypothetical protein